METVLTKIPYVNLAAQHASLKEEILEAIGPVLERGQFILGKEVEEFERRFAQACGTRFAVGLNSCTDALVLSLRVLGIGPGDEVITPANSFIATATSIILAGARPVLVDACDDYNIDPSQIEKAITPKTKAILPVHLTGRPANMDPILAIAKSRGLFVLEDGAQAVLAQYRGRTVGSFGNVGCFSLHPLKNLAACGDGGVITTNDETIYERFKLMRNLGLRNRDNCEMWSGNSRLDTLQAAILLAKWPYLEKWTEGRRFNAGYYYQGLSGVPQVKVPRDEPHERSVYHTCIIQAQRRDELKAYLAQKGIETGIHYPIPIHLQKAAVDFGYGPGSFPVTERQARMILSLPVYPELTTENLDYIIKTIKEFYR